VKIMRWEVIGLRLEGEHALWVCFKDGLEGVVKFMPSAFRGVFTRLSNPKEFALAYVVDGAVTWPGELDLAPDAMHEQIAHHGEWTLR
jgi:hypothetical protein